MQFRLSGVRRNVYRKGGEPSLGNMKKWPDSEMRGHQRTPINVPIECRAGQITVRGSAENIGLGGVLVRADQTFPWDEVVTLLFALPGSTDTFHLKGRIAHVVPGVFMGLEFVELPPYVRERIDQYISTVMSGS